MNKKIVTLLLITFCSSLLILDITYAAESTSPTLKPESKKITITPTPDEKKETIDSLRKKLTEKINQDKDRRLIFLGTLQKLDVNQLSFNTFEGKSQIFAYDPSITETVIMGKSKSSTTAATLKPKDFLILTSDGTSANLALKIIKPKLAEFLFGEIVSLDEENKKFSLVSHITREEKEIFIGKSTQIYLPEPKSLTTKKSSISKLKVGDFVEVAYYPIDQKDDDITPIKLTALPKELISDK